MKRLLIIFLIIFGAVSFCVDSVQAQCYNQSEDGSIEGPTCIHSDDHEVHTYRYVFSERVDTSDVIRIGWSSYGALEVIEQGYDYIRVKSTDTGAASLSFSYKLRSDQNKSCVKSGCVSYSYYAGLTINKIYNSRFMPVIEGNPLIVKGEKSTFWVSGLLPNASLTWTAPSYMKKVKSSSNSEYITYDVLSAPQKGDSLQVRMNIVCNSGLVGKMALIVGTEKPEIEEDEALACVPVTQDSIRLAVKEPQKDYSYWWESWDENWTFLPMNNGTQAILRFAGEVQQGIIVLYATNDFDTVYTPYKVVRCNKTCSYDTTQGIDISQAKCLRPGDIAIFRINADPDAVSYTWEFGGGWTPETYTTTAPYDTVVYVVVGDAPGWAKVTGENCSGEWHMETEDSIPVVTYEAQLTHYDGCVNIGLPDTLLLRVENIKEGISYQWQLPENWTPEGCDTCGEITVAVREPLAAVKTYSVRADNTKGCVSIWKEDTVSIRGADTALLIVDFEDIDMYVVLSEDFGLVDENAFVYLWYKTTLSPDNFVDSFEMVAKYLFKGEPPILAYRYNEGCWSVTEKVIDYNDIEFSLFDTKRKATNEVADVEQDISMIPNPTTNQTLLRWDADMDRIEVVSESGQRVLTYNVAGLQQKIVDMSTMPTGIYFVRFLVDNSVVATKKLIKR